MEKVQQDMSGQFFVFYDGACPVCRREMHWLKKKAQRRKIKKDIHWVDIAQEGFDAKIYGKSREDFMSSLHVFDGKIYVKGMDSIRCLYRELGLGKWMDWTGTIVIKQIVDLGYKVFAKWRPRFRQCSLDSTSCPKK
ncbi:MAG: DUF393 domain-containing protein [Proteobacteria bacterium]|nr:DUF393 domain-containing protein [Pseudomonadota bacterium]